MKLYTKICLIPVALAEAVIGGAMFALACFIDFWRGGHAPFDGQV